MKIFKTLLSGFAGATALTIAHQVLRSVSRKAPRMDLMGEEALIKTTPLKPGNISHRQLYNTTMAADIVANTLYYSLAGAAGKKNIVKTSAALGLAAGIGAVCIPKYIGLNNSYSNRTTATKIMTVGIYLLGGIVSGKLMEAMEK